MTKEEIESRIVSYIYQSQEGLEIENPKVDFKREWYDLKEKEQINEFLKDTTAIANTVGLDGFIVIGYDEKQRIFYSSTFSDSKLRDTSDLNGLINKRVDRLFTINSYDIEIDDNKLSVIHIPPSFDKPHVIRNYTTFDKSGNEKTKFEHRIFVRKGTSVYPASKYDLDFMYYDRKNILPEYELHGSYHVGSCKFARDQKGFMSLQIGLNFENTGRRPIAITQIRIHFYVFGGSDENERLTFISDEKIKSENIVIQPGHLTNREAKFNSTKTVRENHPDWNQQTLNRDIRSPDSGLKCHPLNIQLANGKTLKIDLVKSINRF